MNVRNNGTIQELPEAAVIERNCVIGKNGVLPINAGKLSLKVRGLIQSVKAYEELAIEAAVKGDKGLALQALAAHPLVPSVSIAKKLLADILAENKGFLPQYNQL